MGGRRWTKEEDKILVTECYNKTYLELTKLLSNRTRESVEIRCQQKGLNKFIKDDRLTWTDDEENLLKKIYSTSTVEELEKFFPNKTISAINTHSTRLGLYKDKNTIKKIYKQNSIKNSNYWSNEKNDLLIKEYKNNPEYIYNIFHNHCKEFIEDKLVENNLIELRDKDIVNKLIKNNQIHNLQDIIYIYKLILSGTIKNFCHYKVTKYDIIFCLKYFLHKNKICHNKEYWLNINYNKFLTKVKLINYVKRLFNNYYDFICCCFPQYKFKRWEFKKLDVPNGYWNNKYNCYQCIEHTINNLLNIKIIKEPVDLLLLRIELLRKYTNKTLISFYGFSIIVDYFNYKNIDYSKYNNKIFDNFLFDSKEELYTYKIFKYFNLNVFKGVKSKDKMYNEVCNEYYIPDFIIKLNDKIIISEYFGYFKDNPKGKRLINYYNKTKRKISYYENRDDIYFLPVFPKDIKSESFLKNKIISFFMSNFGIDIRGDFRYDI